jgi:hypothetical protein
MIIQVVSDSTLILVLKRLSLGSSEVHTGHVHPIRGTPVLVPDPRIVIRNKTVELNIYASVNERRFTSSYNF